MQETTRAVPIDARAYYTSIRLGLKWYNYEDLKRLSDLHRTTTAVGSLPARLAELVAEDAAEMGLAA